MTIVQDNTKATETAKPATATNGRKEEAPKAAIAPATVPATEPEADETPDRFEVLAKIIRILKPLPVAERHAVVSAIVEMVK